MTDSKTAERKKLSVIPRGHWRNKWFAPVPIDFDDGDQGPRGEYIGWAVFGTEGEARAGAREWMATVKTRAGKAAIYLGPVFFPDP